jgi:hypothetical protein
MKDNMVSLFKYVKDLFNQGFGMSIEYWLIVLLLIFILIYIGIKIANTTNNNKEKLGSLYFGITLSSLRILICIIGVSLLISVVSFIFFYQQYFVQKHYAPDFIVIILVLSIAFIIVLFKLNKGVKIKLPKYIKPPLSLEQKTIHGTYISNKFEKSKWKIICLIFPFVLLLFHSTVEQDAEVSILIDNSGSTDMYREYGRKYLAVAARNVYENTEFNISYFNTYNDDFQCQRAINSLQKDVTIICDKDNFEDLSSKNFHFNNSISASNFIGGNQIASSCLGTPLLECLWANYLFTKQNSNFNENTIKILILLTDGQGNLYLPSNSDFPHVQVSDNFDVFEVPEKKSNISMDEYYDKISIVNIGENDGEALFLNFDYNNIYDGQDKESYKVALDLVTRDIQKRNWNFIYIISFFASVVVLSFLFIKLQPMYNNQNK